MLPEGTKFMVLAPVVRGRKGEYGKLFEELRAEGFTRVKVDGELRRLEEDIVLDKKYKHDISVVIDRLVMRPDLRKRLADSIETAVALAEGIMDIEDADTGEVTTYSERFMCLHCGTSMPELEPRMFSFNSPHGACPRCTGLGSQMEIDPELIVPGPVAVAQRGGDPAVVHERVELLRADDAGDRRALRGRHGHAVGGPPRGGRRRRFLYGTDGDRLYISYRNRYGRRRSYTTTFEGIVPNLERRYRETDSDYVAREDRGVHDACGRARTAAARGCGRSRWRCCVGGLGHPRGHADVGAGARSSGSSELELSRHRARRSRG